MTGPSRGIVAEAAGDAGPADRVRALAELPRMVELRRALHRLPELGLELPETAAIVERELRGLGLAPSRAGSGLWVDLGTRGPLVALRADMDALPIDEASGAAYASEKPGRMHACGHDAHAAALLGAVRILAAEAASGALSYRVRALFQAGEEGQAGALRLIEAGALEGVSAIAGGHSGDLSDELEPGQAGFMAGPLMAASDRFEGAFIGSGGHGSAPHRSPDPISALAEYILALGTFRSRELDQSRPSVVSVCCAHSGSTHNVIPERADYKGTARSLHPDIRAQLERRIGEIAASIAAMRGLRSEFTWIAGYPPVVNDAAATEACAAAAEACLGPERVVRLRRAIMGGEDFCYYLQRIPGCFWFLNSQAPERGIVYPNHNPRFDLDEKYLADMAALHLGAVRALAALHPGTAPA